MVKDFKYIIKRIIIGVGIALILSFISFGGRPYLPVKANTIESYDWGYHTGSPAVTDSQWYFDLTDNQWLGERYGYLYFTFDIQEVVNTDAPVNLRSVVVTSGTTNYLCHVGTVSTNNLGSGISSNILVNNTTYSSYCPVDFGFSGLDRVTFNFVGGGSSLNTFTIQTSSQATFEKITQEEFNSVAQTITNNQNTNTQNIINNQDQNTQEQIESQKVCTFVDNKNIGVSGKYLTNTGYEGAATPYIITNYISIDKYTEIKVVDSTSLGSVYLCFYNVNKSVISCILENSFSSNDILTIPSNASFVRFSISRSSNIPTFNICRNGNQAIADSQQQINNTLNDNTGVSDSDISDLFGDFESSDTPITDLLTMPLTLIQAYISGMSGTCQSISLGRLYNTNLIIPCIDIESKLGSNLWSMIDILFAMFMVYNLGQLFITAFDSLTSLKDNFSWLYGVEGRHVAAPSTRVERNSDLY